MKPTVSVIVPIYNVEPWLPRCVESILAQTHRELEILLVDDGSPDRGGALCDGYAAKDPRVKVLHRENGGLSAARNAGLDAMTGELVAFVDGDDWLEPAALEALYAEMARTGAELVIGGYDRVEDTTGRTSPAPDSPDARRVYPRDEGVRRFFRFGCAAWGRLYRRELFDGVRFPVGEINEDEAVMPTLLDRCTCIAETDAILCHYRCRPGSITAAPFSAAKLAWPRHARENLRFAQRKYPNAVPEAAARYRTSLLWALREIALSEGDFPPETAALQTELRECMARFPRVPWADGRERLRALLCARFPLNLYRFILRLRHGGR